MKVIAPHLCRLCIKNNLSHACQWRTPSVVIGCDNSLRPDTMTRGILLLKTNNDDETGTHQSVLPYMIQNCADQNTIIILLVCSEKTK